MRRRLWILGGLLLVVTLAVWLLPKARPPLRSGDPLLDIYLNAADKEADAINTYNRITLASLKVREVEFAADSRYWQLRANVAATEAGNTPAVRRAHGMPGRKSVPMVLAAFWPEGKAARTEQLQLALDQGHADANTVLLLLIEERKDLSSPERMDLLNKAVELGPDEAWPRYMRGFGRFTRGDRAGALADFRAGNAAKVNRLPSYFPYSEIQAAIANGKVYGSKALMGSTYFACLGLMH